MGELEELKKSMIEKYSDKLAFFEIEGPMNDIARSVSWGGEDYNEFLDMAIKVGAKIIYYSEAFPDDAIEKYVGHANDIAELDLGFMHDWILHTMVLYADWYTPSNDSENIEETAEQFEEKSAEEWAKELNQYIIKEFPNAKLEDIDRISEAFWESKGFEYIKLDTKDRMKMDMVKDIVRKQQQDIIREREKQELPKIVEECIKWAKENGLKKLTKASLNAFLAEKEIYLSSVGENALYYKVNLELSKKV